LFDFTIHDQKTISALKNNPVVAILETQDILHRKITALREAEYTIATDTKGLYANEGENPAQVGYMSFSMLREPCCLRIYRYGKPMMAPVTIYVAKYQVPESANDPIGPPVSVQTCALCDGDPVALVEGLLQPADNAVFYFVYDGQYANNQMPVYNPGNYAVMDTGAFACLRVHRMQDYGKYIDPQHPEYTPPDWNVVYAEVFQMYDIAYPIMALVHPFNEATWNNGTIAGLVAQRIRPEVWQDITYMPRSRELSQSQYELLMAWVKTFD
jgi:hypothetical protein